MPLDAVFGRLLGSPLAVEELDPRSHAGSLLPEEASIVADAVPRRVSEFTAGRACARQALSKLQGPTEYPLLQGEDRGPIWPSGFVGSITHANFWCAAAVARTSDVRAVGIDIESVAPVRPSVLERVCTTDERRRIEASRHPDQMAKVFFSAKESVYKCQRPITGAYLGFHAVELEVADGRFRAVFRRPAGEFAPGDALCGRYLADSDWVATACVLEAE